MCFAIASIAGQMPLAFLVGATMATKYICAA
jgi:hypothetical protein